MEIIRTINIYTLFMQYVHRSQLLPIAMRSNILSLSPNYFAFESSRFFSSFFLSHSFYLYCYYCCDYSVHIRCLPYSQLPLSVCIFVFVGLANMWQIVHDLVANSWAEKSFQIIRMRARAHTVDLWLFYSAFLCVWWVLRRAASHTCM